MTDFEDLKTSTIHYGKNNFIEVALTKVTDSDGSDQFLGLKRGFLSESGKNYKGNIPVPLNEDVVKKAAAAMLKIGGVTEFDYESVVEELEFEDGDN